MGRRDHLQLRWTASEINPTEHNVISGVKKNWELVSGGEKN